MRKYISVVGVLLSVLFSLFIIDSSISIKPNSTSTIDLNVSDKEFILLTLSSELEGINDNLPHKIDNYTTLDNVAIKDEIVVNTYTIKNTPEFQLTTESIVTVLIPKLVHQVCGDQSKREFLENGIPFSMDYFDSDKALIFKTLITIDECNYELSE